MSLRLLEVWASKGPGTGGTPSGQPVIKILRHKIESLSVSCPRSTTRSSGSSRPRIARICNIDAMAYYHTTDKTMLINASERRSTTALDPHGVAYRRVAHAPARPWRPVVQRPADRPSRTPKPVYATGSNRFYLLRCPATELPHRVQSRRWLSPDALAGPEPLAPRCHAAGGGVAAGLLFDRQQQVR